MEKVFARVSSSSPLSVAVARTSQSPFPLAEISKTILLLNEEKFYFINEFYIFY
jgi:hypothetical protein